MLSFFYWILIGQALIVFAFVMIYVAGFAGGGIVAGIGIGILLEIAAIGMQMGVCAVQPFPGKSLIYASIGGLIENDHHWRYCRCDLQTCTCAKFFAVI